MQDKCSKMNEPSLRLDDAKVCHYLFHELSPHHVRQRLRSSGLDSSGAATDRPREASDQNTNSTAPMTTRGRNSSFSRVAIAEAHTFSNNASSFPHNIFDGTRQVVRSEERRRGKEWS